MYCFESLLELGVRAAGMSDESDGDCGWGGIASGHRDTFLKHLGVPSQPLLTLRQVHGSHVLAVDETTPGQGARTPMEACCDGDGLVTAVPGIPIGVTIADCVPVLLYDPHTRVVAALHAGREGTTAKIAAIGLALMVSRYGADPAAVHGVIGPSAGPCCYEVSEEIRDACVARDVVAQGRHLDLWITNKQQLLAGGMKSAHISITGHCTLCSTGYYSFRRQQTSCRNLAIIML